MVTDAGAVKLALFDGDVMLDVGVAFPTVIGMAEDVTVAPQLLVSLAVMV
jgi:hypothetical protein